MVLNKYPTDFESKKYSLLFAGNYHAGPVKRALTWGIPRMILNNAKVVDLGCGLGTSRLLLGDYGEWTGIDIAAEHIIRMQKEAGPKDIFKVGNICDLPYDDDYFDLGVCIDVLEHIPPEFAERAVEEICRVCKSLVISVSCIPSKHLDFNGGGLHLTIRPPLWWHEQFNKHIKVAAKVILGPGNGTFTCGPAAHTIAVAEGFYEHAQIGRLLHDGTFFIPRPNRELEKLFDGLYDRVPNELRWAPRIEYRYSLDVLQKTDQPVVITGKGPSLDHLRKSFFDNMPKAPVLCVNESLFMVEGLDIDNPVYLVQHDGINCRPVKESTTCILDKDAKFKYPEIDRKFIYNKYGLELSTPLTALAAIRIAVRYMGTKHLFLVSFDACTHGDIGYAQIVGYDVKTQGDGTKGERFLKHRELLISHAEGVKITWVTPNPDGSDSYTPQLSQDNLEEHHVPDPEECSSASPANSDSPS